VVGVAHVTGSSYANGASRFFLFGEGLSLHSVHTSIFFSRGGGFLNEIRFHIFHVVIEDVAIRFPIFRLICLSRRSWWVASRFSDVVVP
jgi:hypothetical protein